MPIEETDQFIHVRVLDPDQFEMCRLTDFDGKLPQGVRAKYCKYANRDEWAVQAYIFEKAQGWTLDKAKDWVQTHRGFSLSYYASAAPREENGRRLVDIKVIDTTKNANNWRVTDQGLKRALSSLIGAPLLAYPDHSGSIMVGRFIDTSKPDGYAVGTAEVTDQAAWEKIKNGEWKWVSPQVYAFETREEDGGEVLDSFSFQHVAFVPNPAYKSTKVLNAAASEGLPTFSAALTSIMKRRRNELSAQSMSAYQLAPEDRDWNFNEADYTPEQLKRACAWYAGHDPDLKQSYKLPHHLPDGTLVWNGVKTAMTALLGGRGGVDIPESDRREVYNHLSAHYKEFDKEPPEYHASQFQNNQGTASQSALEAGKQSQETKKGEQEKLSQDIAALQTKVTELTEQNKTLNGKNTELETTVKTLKASQDALAAERHAEKVQKLLELRAKANLFDASKRNEEAERLGKFSDTILDQLIVDTESIVKALPKPSGPKATYTAEQTNDAEERVRERLFGYRRDKAGKIIAGGV